MKVGDYIPATKPFEHQEEGFRFSVRHRGRCALYWEPGTGKTKTAIDFACFGYLSDKIRRVLVIAPLNAIGVWEEQIVMHTPSYIPHVIETLRGTTQQRAKRLAILSAQHAGNEHLVWVLINYQAVWRQIDKKRKIEDMLKNFGFDLVIADEGHRLSTPGTKQSNAACGIAHSATYRLLLTGTAVKNKPLDLYGQMKFIDPFLFTMRKERFNRKEKKYEEVDAPMTWTEFRQRYSVSGSRGFWDVREYVNMDELFERVHSVALVKKKADCLDLPEKMYQKISVELDPETRARYDEMEDQMIAFIEQSEEMKKKAKNRFEVLAIARATIAKLLRCRQLANGFVGVDAQYVDAEDENNIHTLSSEKIDATMDLLSDLLVSDEKVVIFTVFKHDYERLGKRLDESKITWAGIRGGVSDRQRKTMIESFQNKDNPRVMLIQIDSGAEAITLHRAHVVIFHNVHYSYDKFTQAQDRIHRIGQAKTCVYYSIVARNTIEEDIYAKLLQKEDFARAFTSHPAAMAQQMKARLKRYRAQGVRDERKKAATA